MLAMIVAFISCDDFPIAVTGVTLNVSSLTLIEGGEVTLTATVSPEDAVNKNVAWSSSTPAVATVEAGKVTAVKAGTSTITVTTEDGGMTATCEVTVVPEPVEPEDVPVKGVSLDKTNLELTEGDKVVLTATVTPDNATDKSVIWSSSDTAVVSVEDGKVTAVKVGTASISVTTNNGSFTATCEVTVVEKTVESEEVAATGVSLNNDSIELVEGTETTLIATVTPDNATNKEVTWFSNNENVAQVEDGKVKALEIGTSTITVITKDGGYMATCNVVVVEKVPATGLGIDKYTVKLKEGEVITLTVTIYPENATDRNVVWTSSDEDIVEVQNGKLTAKKHGFSTVTARIGEIWVSCMVQVMNPGAHEGIGYDDYNN